MPIVTPGDAVTWTYKLRLSPVLRNGRFGAVPGPVAGDAGRYPVIPELVEINGCSLGFELYGARNTHLILYEEPLDCVLLFGVTPEGKPLSPSALDSRGVPAATLLRHAGGREGSGGRVRRHPRAA